MNIEEIEGLSLAELRARHDELVTTCKDVKPAVLAARYVQARTDAAMRDESMAKQAETLEALQTGLKAADERVVAINATAKQRIEAVTESVAIVQEALVTQTASSEQIQGALDAALAANAELQQQIAMIRGERNAAAELAKARRLALATVMEHANSLAAKVAPLLADEG